MNDGWLNWVNRSVDAECVNYLLY